MGASNLIRVYYIANAHCGTYFVLCDNLEQFSYRMSSYLINLYSSSKVNNYLFGSVEMTVADYEKYKTETMDIERKLIKAKEMGHLDGTSEKAHEAILKDEIEIGEKQKKEYSDNVIPLFGGKTPIQ